MGLRLPDGEGVRGRRGGARPPLLPLTPGTDKIAGRTRGWGMAPTRGRHPPPGRPVQGQGTGPSYLGNAGPTPPSTGSIAPVVLAALRDAR